MYLPHQSFKWVIVLKWTDPFFKLNEEHLTFHLEYKHSGTFANRIYEELSYSKNPRKCDPILVTLLKMRPHYESSRENATPSSSTSPLAPYKEVPPRGVLPLFRRSNLYLCCQDDFKQVCPVGVIIT